MGAACDMIVKPYYAMICGFVIGAISAFGYAYLTPWLKTYIKLHDTCGIHNLHAMPGFAGAIVSVITCNRNSLNSFSTANYDIFFPDSATRTPA